MPVVNFLAVMVALFQLCWTGQAAADDLVRAGRDLARALSAEAHCSGHNSVSVGIWPFDEADLPVGTASAGRIYTTVLAELIGGSPDCIRFLDGDGVAANIAYLNRVGAFEKAGRKPLDIIESNLRDVDYTIAGALVEQSGRVFVSFKLIDSRQGQTLAVTPVIEVPRTFVDAQCGDGALPVDVAVGRVAEEIADRASSMRNLVVEGGYFGNTHARTEFGRYLESLLASRIAQGFENVITGRTLSVHLLDDGAGTGLLRIRGLDVLPRQLDPRIHEVQAPDQADNDSYLLSFRYWLCGERAKLHVTARNRTGTTVGWIGNIRLDQLPEGLALEPPTPAEANYWGPDGAFTFDMTSQRGLNPAYKPGEIFEVLFRLDRDAWLFCFYTDAAGDTIQILPNPLYGNKRGANFFAGGRLHLFPDGARTPVADPVVLRINAKTSGIEIFQCIATSRDVASDLPESLRGTSMRPLPLTLASRLTEIFAAIGNKAMSSARMTVTVME
ncbi:DUF4384 domain-containing protein [Mesorhizobium sp. KR9-304]|uniref:DUF4384 domain-containing protein n=1 Tax=Mesorhizobium sp. KR9-304 TaxID=3156614 RepID=UPI0032B32366